ncbi:MAG: class II aldolase/adducin family protein [Bacteroidota bacterium]|nr:class II aldolase/adducin family protein [Bacteroidota bacterium]
MSDHTIINELLKLTKPFVGRADLIQGPGGNTSVKDEAGNMYIKASGFRFNEMNDNGGYSAVSSGVIEKYFRNVQIISKEQCEKESLELITNNILSDANGVKFPKPSMETGFHAVLDKYVIHTHSVWANLVNCNELGTELRNKVQEKLAVPIVHIPFVSPGFGLSYLITQELIYAEKNNSPKPKIFFLENHGIIAHGDNMEEVTNLLTEVDSSIAKIFSVEIDAYPVTQVELKEESFFPVNDYCSRILSKYKVAADFFDQVLFPDQTVFFKGNITLTGEESKKINISADYTLKYKGNEREAESIHETMTAYLFLYDTLRTAANKIKLIKGKEIDYINNMDMEKHRKNIMKNS